MKAHNAKSNKKQLKSSTNLTLSQVALQQLDVLQEKLTRPSRSNTVEYLITKAHEAEKAKAA